MDIELIHPNPQDSRHISKKAQVDTGADGSIIPRSVRDRWQLNQVGLVSVLDCHNRLTYDPTYDVRIAVNGLVNKIVEVTLIDSDEILLGRDIMNELKMCADGKTKSLTLEDP